MRCLACDVLLNDYEATRRYAPDAGTDRGEFIDLCSACYACVNAIEPLASDFSIQDSEPAKEEDWL